MRFDRLPLFIGSALLALALSFPASAAASDLVVSSPQTFGSLDGSASDSDGIADGVLTVDGDLTVDSGGAITCNDAPPLSGSASACDIEVVVTGSASLRPGSSIVAENAVSAGNGGDITINITSDLSLTSATISSSKTSASGTGYAGTIDIGAGGDVFIGPGSSIAAVAANGRGGEITLDGGDVTIVGNIRSAGAQSGSSTAPDGNQVAVNALCGLLVGASSKISSEGGAAGADLVHLQAGCDVLIRGLVTSTSLGATGSSANHCEDPVIKTKTTTQTSGYRSKSSYHQSYNHSSYGHHSYSHTPPPTNNSNRPGCVEVWSAGSLLIDHSAGSVGEVSGDLGPAAAVASTSSSHSSGYSSHGGYGGCSGKPPSSTTGSARIDLYARSDIGIVADPGGSYAVHANDGRGDNVLGGIVNVKSTEGFIFATGPSVQADANGQKSDGGKITVEGKFGVEMPDAALVARGDDNASGGYGAGGKISVRSYNDLVSWTNGVGDVSPTGTGVTSADRGAIAISYCTTTDTTGTSFPSIGTATSPTSSQACGGAPTVPSNVVLS